MPFGGHLFNQIQQPVDVRASGINREKYRVQSGFFGRLGGGDRQLNGFFQRPFIALFDQVFAGWNFNNDAVYTAIGRQFDIRNHTARKTKYFGVQVAFDDFPDRRLVIGGYRRHSGLDAVNTDFRQFFGDLDFVLFF